MIQTALLVAAGLAGLLVLAELALRAGLRLRDRWYVWTPHQSTRMHLDPEALPTLEPLVRIEFNRDGERGTEPPRDLDGCFRVLVAGGSAAEGYYLDQDANWPQVVQELLREPAALERLGARDAHVGNVSRSLVPCEALATMLARILPRYRRLDAIVFFVGASDVVHWLERGTPPELVDGTIPERQMFAVTPRLPWGLHRKDLALWRAFSSLYRARLRPVQERRDVGRQLVDLRRMRAGAKTMIDEVPDPAPLLDYFERHFRAMLRVAKGGARRVLVVRQPWFDRPLTEEETAVMWNFALGRPRSAPVDTYYTHRVVAELMGAVDRAAERVAAEEGVEQLDVLSQLDLDLDTFYDYLHFTPGGARHLAQLVTAALLGPAEGAAAGPSAARSTAREGAASGGRPRPAQRAG